LGIFKLGDQRTTLFHLQAFVLLTIGSLATSQPTTTWLFAEQGLLRAQVRIIASNLPQRF
jgi:hypothetical protein